MLTWRHGGHVGGVNKETAAILEQWNILLGIKLYFYANPSFCFIVQIWLLVTWANTLYWEERLTGNLNFEAIFENMQQIQIWKATLKNGKISLGVDVFKCTNVDIFNT